MVSFHCFSKEFYNSTEKAFHLSYKSVIDFPLSCVYYAAMQWDTNEDVHTSPTSSWMTHLVKMHSGSIWRLKRETAIPQMVLVCAWFKMYS